MKIVLFLFMLLIQTKATKRILDVYCINEFDKVYLEQINLLKSDTLGLKERDIIVRSHLRSSTFKIVLTGKDGGIKFSDTKIIPLTKLYSIIDVMPMRREEILRKENTTSIKN